KAAFNGQGFQRRNLAPCFCGSEIAQKADNLGNIPGQLLQMGLGLAEGWNKELSLTDRHK
ncbi:hypothetical protein H634G_11796, partial [Metarhizium anisopliae BRIP 53293]